MKTRSAKKNSVMKKKSAKKKSDVQSGRGDSSTSTSLDENLWGALQHHIDLADSIYSKLPFEEFFQLRIVCNDWYDIACKRLGLKEQIHKPFFSLFTKGCDGQLDGILIYNALSRSWEWRKGWTHNHSFDFVASEGVVYSAHGMLGSSMGSSACAFHWQSKMYQHLDPPPTPPNINEMMILGMSVSEKQGPFNSFRVVRGSQDFDTQVYESGMWQTKPCRVPKPEKGGSLQASTGCVDCNGRVYITIEHSREIFVYDFEKSSWSSLLGPCDWVSKQQPQYCCLDTLGAWNDRVFDVTCDFQPGRRKKNRSLQVWELVDESLHKWKVYDCMPKDLCSWLRSTRGFHPLHTKSGDVSVQASFCGDFMLVYSWDFRSGSAGRFCLFNMATKNWQKLNISSGTVAISEEYPSDLYDSENSMDSLANESSLDGCMDDLDYDNDLFYDDDLYYDSDSGGGFVSRRLLTNGSVWER